MHDIRPHIPELFTPGTMLYIGARKDACSWLTEFYEAGNIIDVMEAWKPNCDSLKGDERIHRLFCMPVDSRPGYVATPEDKTYDKIVWWHGPEHLIYESILPILRFFSTKCDILALAAPDGFYPQGSHEGNYYEIHKSYLYEHNFHNWGFQTKVDPGSEIVAWK